MLIGVIADDFTGASDIANTLTKGLPGQGGLATAQYMGIPGHAADPAIDAGVVALKSRSIPVAEAVAQSLAALDWLLAQGCRQIVFKYCSTFDSTPEGNIGPVGEALARALGVKGVIACPAFPQMGRSLHQGHLFVHDRLLNQSGMENHPLTPMSDPDLRRWLARQSATPVGLVAAPVVRAGAAAVTGALAACADRGETLVICDAAVDADLVTLGQAAAGHRLLTGGSGIALGLPANLIAAGLARPVTSHFSGISGRAAILAGSCSGATRGQIALHARDNPVLAIAVDDLMAGRIGTADLLDFLGRHGNSLPLVYSSATPAEVADAQERHGREAVADALDRLFAETAVALVDQGVTRLVVAGGETSGAVASALDLGDLRIGPEIDPGVPALISPRRGIALALKSGNFGRETFFTHAAGFLAGESGAQP